LLIVNPEIVTVLPTLMKKHAAVDVAVHGQIVRAGALMVTLLNTTRLVLSRIVAGYVRLKSIVSPSRAGSERLTQCAVKQSAVICAGDSDVAREPLANSPIAAQSR